MNAKTLFAVAITTFASFAAIGSFSTAHAGEAEYEYPTSIVSSQSRADVKALALQARAAGLVADGERSVVLAATGPALSRAQVRAETLEAIRVGAISHGEQTTLPTAAQLQSIRMAGLQAVQMMVASR